MKNFTVILSLENKKNGLEKVWKKSWILFTKKCTNPAYCIIIIALHFISCCCNLERTVAADRSSVIYEEYENTVG